MKEKLKPDLVISGFTEMDDLIELLEKNKTELYSLGTLIQFFNNTGMEAILPVLLQGVANNDLSEVNS